MLMVVMLHVNLFGGILTGYNPKDNLYSFLISHFFEDLCIIAVNLYVIISGYFLSGSPHPFKINKLCHIILITVFWSWLIGGFACFFLGADIINFIHNGIFPVLSGKYWFVTTYVLMYFLSPYYNKTLQVLSKREHLLLISFLGLFFILVPMIWNSVDMNSGYSLYWFSYLYVVASFIRKYNVIFSIKKLLFTWFLTLFLQVTITYLLDGIHLLLNYNSIFVFVNSLCCFLLFKSLNIIKGKKIILFFSPLTFGIYLIHINSATVSWIYREILPIKEFADSIKFGIFFSLIFFTTLIFLISALFEFLRIRLFLMLKMDKKIDEFCQKILFMYRNIIS